MCPYKDHAKKREAGRRRYAAHPEKVCEAVRRWRAAHPEKNREASRRWHAACSECGAIHPGGVVILDDNVLSLSVYAELHPKTWASIERSLDEKKGPHYWGDGHAHPELAPKEDPRRRDDQDESP